MGCDDVCVGIKIWEWGDCLSRGVYGLVLCLMWMWSGLVDELVFMGLCYNVVLGISSYFGIW